MILKCRAKPHHHTAHIIHIRVTRSCVDILKFEGDSNTNGSTSQFHHLGHCDGWCAGKFSNTRPAVMKWKILVPLHNVHREWNGKFIYYTKFVKLVSISRPLIQRLNLNLRYKDECTCIQWVVVVLVVVLPSGFRINRNFYYQLKKSLPPKSNSSLSPAFILQFYNYTKWNGNRIVYQDK